jgi:SagB-type dehydrogenase family enzyme
MGVRFLVRLSNKRCIFMARLRTSQCLVFLFKQNRLIGFNFLTKKAFSCSPAMIGLLQRLSDWVDERDCGALMPNSSGKQATALLTQLIELSALVKEGSEETCREHELQHSWEWGLGTSLLHFSVKDAGSYVSLAEAQQWRQERAVCDPSPPLYCQHNGLANARPLERNDNDPLLAFFAKRRTNRTSVASAVTLATLADCLYAGLGITGFVETETGKLPLSMTPSGGARNPFEAYIYARQIEGLGRGFYHYSAANHSLIRLSSEAKPDPSHLLGDQDWANAMPCIIFLVAYFERTMWKYRDDNAYRVVLIEAGHIAQNIMLMATGRCMTACPTALLRHSEIHTCLGIDRLTRSVLYALTLSHPDETAASYIP